MGKKIIQVDMDGVVADYKGYMEATGETHHDERFFLDMPPMEGAVEAINKLNERYEIIFCTTAPWSVPSSGMDKRIWIDKYFPEIGYKSLTTTHRKDLQIGEYLIDDRTKNGAGEFRGEHIHFGTYKFPDWESVLNYLL